MQLESGAYSERYLASKMQRLAKIVYGSYPLTIFAKRSILDACEGFEYASGIALKLFLKSSRSQMFFKMFFFLKTYNFIKKDTPTQCFPVNIAKFLRTAFFIKHLRWLLL